MKTEINNILLHLIFIIMDKKLYNAVNKLELSKLILRGDTIKKLKKVAI